MLSYEIIIECTTINLGHKSMEKGMVSVRSVLMGSVAGLSGKYSVYSMEAFILIKHRVTSCGGREQLVAVCEVPLRVSVPYSATLRALLAWGFF